MRNAAHDLCPIWITLNTLIGFHLKPTLPGDACALWRKSGNHGKWMGIALKMGSFYENAAILDLYEFPRKNATAEFYIALKMEIIEIAHSSPE